MSFFSLALALQKDTSKKGNEERETETPLLTVASCVTAANSGDDRYLSP